MVLTVSVMANSTVSAVAALEAALGDQAAEADALAGRDLLFRHLLGRVEEDDGVAQREQHEEHGDAEDADAEADEGGAALLAGHEPSPRALAARAESSASALVVAVEVAARLGERGARVVLCGRARRRH